MISVLILSGCNNNEEIISNSSTGAENQNQTIITDGQWYEDDRLVLKTINFDFINESDIFWKYNENPKVDIIDNLEGTRNEVNPI